MQKINPIKILIELLIKNCCYFIENNGGDAALSHIACCVTFFGELKFHFNASHPMEKLNNYFMHYSFMNAYYYLLLRFYFKYYYCCEYSSCVLCCFYLSLKKCWNAKWAFLCRLIYEMVWRIKLTSFCHFNESHSLYLGLFSSIFPVYDRILLGNQRKAVQS